MNLSKTLSPRHIKEVISSYKNKLIIQVIAQITVVHLDIFRFKMSNFMKISSESAPRVELHEKLGLTGAEISINTIGAGECVPFIHSHKQNEEIYYVISGSGKAIIDNEEVNLVAGDWVKISPVAERQFFANKDNAISYICIQVKENSLEGFTANDAIIK